MILWRLLVTEFKIWRHDVRAVSLQQLQWAEVLVFVLNQIFWMIVDGWLAGDPGEVVSLLELEKGPSEGS